MKILDARNWRAFDGSFLSGADAPRVELTEFSWDKPRGDSLICLTDPNAQDLGARTVISPLNEKQT